VGAAVESVLAQTFQDYEIIVVDDGSTDETRQVLQGYEGKLNYIYQENQDRSAARNTGIRASSGEYIAFLDADDVWLPNKLECQVAVLDQHPFVSLTYCPALYIDTNGNPVRFCGKWVYGHGGAETIVSDRSRDLILGTVVQGGGSTPMVRQSLLDEVGLFDESMNFGEDWDLWVRLSHEGPFAYTPEPLACYRIYGWDKVLIQEASDRSVAQQLRAIEKALVPWREDTDEQERMRAKSVATLQTRAALASIQLGKTVQGRRQLARAMSADPGLMAKDSLVQLAVDRAKLIEMETGSCQDAEAFVHAFFSSLPESAAQFKSARREALGWLYVAGAFEKQQHGDRVAARRLLRQGIIYAPVCLSNLGVVSTALEVWLGKATTNMLRRIARKIMALVGRPVNAKRHHSHPQSSRGVKTHG